MTAADLQADAVVRSRHAARVAELAADVVSAVRDEGAAAVLASIRRALAVPAPDDVDPVVALVTVLAAAVPADQPLYELVAWTRTLRPVPNRPVADTSSHDCDVHLMVSGRAVPDQVSRAARQDAVVELTRLQLTKDEIADQTGMTVRSVERLRARAVAS